MAVNLVEDKCGCSGCLACKSICPVNAISIKEDESGFVYPNVSPDRCINCKKCLSVCPFRNDLCPVSLQETYAAAAQNVNLSESSSGAVFSGIALNFLQRGGVVYGCAMQYENEQITVRHIRVDNEQELQLLKGSKYVQSNTDGIYAEVKKDLELNRKVLFSGTPCQVAGLYGFLGKDDPGLYTVDIVCHGVPSQHFFSSYISYEEGLQKLKVKRFVFRDKSRGWQLHGKMEGIDKNGKEKTVFLKPEDSSYYQLFLNRYTYRDSCYHCPYASKHRSGNITLADYWNIELVHPEMLKENGGNFDTNKGISALVLNNKKGKELINAYGNDLQMKISSYENASKYNRQFLRPSAMPEGRDALLENFRKNYEIIDKQYKSELRIRKLKRKLRAAVPKPIKRIIRKSKT